MTDFPPPYFTTALFIIIDHKHICDITWEAAGEYHMQRTWDLENKSNSTVGDMRICWGHSVLVKSINCKCFIYTADFLLIARCHEKIFNLVSLSLEWSKVDILHKYANRKSSWYFMLLAIITSYLICQYLRDIW